MRRVLRDNGLTLVMLALFIVSVGGQTLTGWHTYNDDQTEHEESSIGLSAYLRTGHFVEAIFENWESEFLQMGTYVLLTVFLYQRGSSESKDPDSEEAVDEDARSARDRPDVPWPVRQGGVALKLYENSLGLALLLLFVVSFFLHAAGGARSFSEEELAHGGSRVSMLHYLTTSQFWFESFQNWQSEFLSVLAIVVLSIFLRQHGSPESKPVAAAHMDTGES